MWIFFLCPKLRVIHFWGFLSIAFCLYFFFFLTASLVKLTLWNINFTLKFSAEKQTDTHTHKYHFTSVDMQCMAAFPFSLPSNWHYPLRCSTVRFKFSLRVESQPKCLITLAYAQLMRHMFSTPKNPQLQFQVIQFNTTIFHACWIPPRTCSLTLP